MTLVPVQPRVCGERRISARRAVALTRFSPACAGNGLAEKPLIPRTFHNVKERTNMND